jgi:hypothetical protein
MDREQEEHEAPRDAIMEDYNKISHSRSSE